MKSTHSTREYNGEYYGEETRRWQLQNKSAVTHYEVSELFVNAYVEVETLKIETSGFSVTGLYPLRPLHTLT